MLPKPNWTKFLNNWKLSKCEPLVDSLLFACCLFEYSFIFNLKSTSFSLFFFYSTIIYTLFLVTQRAYVYIYVYISCIIITLIVNEVCKFISAQFVSVFTFSLYWFSINSRRQFWVDKLIDNKFKRLFTTIKVIKKINEHCQRQ